MKSLDIPMGEVMKDVTVTINITGVERATLRLTVACWIIRLASWVAGCDIKVSMEDLWTRVTPPVGLSGSSMADGNGQAT